MSRFVRVCAVDDIPADRGRPAFADGRLVVLFKIGGNVYAIDDSCPHAGSSLLAGKFDGKTVTCRAHGLRFCVRTGRMPGVEGLRATTYPVQVVAGEVLVAIGNGDTASAASAAD
jgi:3-phenylpropionate/trans-cinnamate dioxygenase ferredoxin subunit